MQAGPRSEEVGFAHDSALEGAEFEPSVPGHDQLNCGAPPCSLPASDRGAGTGSVVQLALFCAANHSVEPGAGTALGVAVWIAARALARVLEDFPVRHRLLEPIEELRGRIDLVIVLALRKHPSRGGIRRATARSRGYGRSRSRSARSELAGA